MIEKFTVNLKGTGFSRDPRDNFPGWNNFEQHCVGLWKQSTAICLDTIINAEFKRQFGDRYPCVKVIRTKTQGAYIRFRAEREYTMFVLRWS